jgi:hypothetical protein
MFKTIKKLHLSLFHLFGIFFADLFPASPVKSFSTCTEPADKKMISEFYIEFLKKSAVNALCEQHADACVPDNVGIRC